MKEMIISGFGETREGKEAVKYTLTNDKGMRISVTDYGAALVEVLVPGEDNTWTDVVLGYGDVAGYEKGDASFGATVGRCANRIGGASFTIDDKTYVLEQNDNGNNLHSGTNYYNKRFWDVRNKSNTKITFTLHSPDGDQGYPGALDMEVTYELTEDNEVKISYYSVPGEDTIINMTNHSYFNLNGHKSGNILNHQVMIDAACFTRADAQSIPTGELLEVAGTPMDFQTEKTIGRDIEMEYEALRFGGGYDHNWVLNNHGKFAKVAQATGDLSGISMEVYTDLPGMQMYTANFLEKEPGKDGAEYGKRSAVCFETQYFPDAIHHDHFEGPICRAGENYATTTVYKFISVQKGKQ